MGQGVCGQLGSRDDEGKDEGSGWVGGWIGECAVSVEAETMQAERRGWVGGREGESHRGSPRR